MLTVNSLQIFLDQPGRSYRLTFIMTAQDPPYRSLTLSRKSRQKSQAGMGVFCFSVYQYSARELDQDILS
jgi:hypothetical protein